MKVVTQLVTTSMSNITHIKARCVYNLINEVLYVTTHMLLPTIEVVTQTSNMCMLLVYVTTNCGQSNQLCYQFSLFLHSLLATSSILSRYVSCYYLCYSHCGQSKKALRNRIIYMFLLVGGKRRYTGSWLVEPAATRDP